MHVTRGRDAQYSLDTVDTADADTVTDTADADTVTDTVLDTGAGRVYQCRLAQNA